MTISKRRNHSPEFKAKVAIAALRGDKMLVVIRTDATEPPRLPEDWCQSAAAGAA